MPLKNICENNERSHTSHNVSLKLLNNEEPYLKILKRMFYGYPIKLMIKNIYFFILKFLFYYFLYI